MKKAFLTKICILLSVVLCLAVVFTGCDMNGGKEYTIQYTDSAGTHQLTVTRGMPYSLESIPYMYGYEFLGLYDAETGGTQYVNASGSSVSVFNDRKNIILYPQFKAIDYTLILDYQGAAVTGDRSFTVAYNSTLPELPKNLVLEHSEFKGWYTAENCKGTQIADEYGLLPTVSVFNENNFELDDENRRAYLYAGFELEKHAVTFHFDEGMATETLQVPYGTSISEVVPKTRNEYGEAVLVWSTKADDDTAVFSGKITGAMELYAVEWAPVIELDANGGDEVTPVVARAGSAISLPTPTKSLAKFLYWETVDGKTANITTMPTKSTTLKAIWQAKIEFNTNGGSEVDDISEEAGTAITLPTSEKDGYIFAGWYTADKVKYERSTMPSEGVALKAGWYKAKSETIVITKDNKNNISDCAHSSEKWGKSFTDGPEASWRRTVDLSQYVAKDGGTVKITLHIDMKNKNAASIFQGGIYVYDGAEISNANYLTQFVHKVTKSTWETFTDSETLEMRSDTLYLCYYAKTSGSESWDCLYFTNMWMNLEYPDTTYLYL